MTRRRLDKSFRGTGSHGTRSSVLIASFPPGTRGRLGRPTSPLLVAVTWSCLWVTSTLGCAGRPGPAQTAHQYASGIQETPPSGAYSSLSRDAQASLSREEFERRLRETPDRTRQDAAEIERALEETDTLVVYAACADGVFLEYQDGSWKVAPSSLELYSQASPIEALRSLVRAYRAGRFDILVRLAPRDKTKRAPAMLKKDLSKTELAELSPAVDAIAMALEDPQIEVLGPHARMSYGAGKSIELSLEGSEWKIEDYDP
jgi:hypothetical protein